MSGFLKNHNWFSIIEKVQSLFIYLFVATLCFRKDLNQAFLISALFFSVFLFQKALFKKNLIGVLIACLGYLISVVSVSYSHNKPEAWFVLEKQLTLFCLPLIFGFSLDLTPSKLRKIIWVFTTAVFAVCIYLLFHFYHAYLDHKGDMPFQDFLNKQIHHQFSAPIDMHATYLSIYVCFAISCALYILFKEKKYFNFIGLIMLPIFIICLFILSSRVVFIPFLLILFLVFPFFIRRVPLLIYFSCLISFVLIALNFVNHSSTLTERLKNDTLRELNISLEQHKYFDLDSVNTNDATRAERWKCALELIKERPLLGYGTGDEKSSLVQKFEKYHFSNSILNGFDAHNQYMAFAIKSGVFGLGAYLLLLIYCFYLAFSRRNFFFIALLIILVITSLSENVLESNKGILFFAFFNTLFLLFSKAYTGTKEVMNNKT